METNISVPAAENHNSAKNIYIFLSIIVCILSVLICFLTCLKCCLLSVLLFQIMKDEEMDWNQLITHQDEYLCLIIILTLATEVRQSCYKKYAHPYMTPYTLKAKVPWSGLTGDPHCIQFIFLYSGMNYNIIASQPAIRKDPPTGVSQRSSLFPVRAW